MAFVRPIVYVFEELASVTVAPEAPDQNTLLVGPAFHIKDFPADKDDIYVGEFVKPTYTKDAPSGSDGSSLGRPDPNTSVIDITDPPGHSGIAGIVLDPDSVQIVFGSEEATLDEVMIELSKGTDGAVTVDTNVFTGTGDFLNKPIVAGDRLLITNPSAPVAANVVVARISEVVGATTLNLEDNISSDDITKLGGSSGLRFRVEHALSSVVIDPAYYTIIDNEVIVKTGSSGVLVTYEAASWPVNYALAYMGYRALRTDLAKVTQLNSIDDVVPTLGTIDERNPLAVGAKVAFANTNTSILVFGVTEDSLTGHTSAKEYLSSREDIYAIVPLTDSLSESAWVSVLAMWKGDALILSGYEKSRFRAIIGSYDTLPTEKSSAPPSEEGYTLAVDASAYDVFVDPSAATEFVTEGVSSDHLLDVTHAGDAALNTISGNTHIFTSGYVTAGNSNAKELLGAMGEKRIRLALADAYVGGHPGESCAYAVREPILREEGGATVAATTAVTITEGTGLDLTFVKLTKPNAFTAVAVGDVVHIQGCPIVSAYNGGWLVKTKTDASNIVVYCTYSAGDTAANVDVYTPDAKGVGATTTAVAPYTVTKAGAFANVAAGDIMYILQDTVNAGNVGMWIITSVLSSDTVRVASGPATMAAGTTADFAVFSRAAESNGSATVTVRKRLTRLRDDSATFLTTVAAGEMIEIPYPEDVDPLHWDTSTTRWLIDSIVSNQVLDAQLDDLEELAPKDFIAGFSGDCSYRIAISLNKDSQVTELNTITSSLALNRCLMVWPNQCYVTDVINNLTGEQNKLHGQYLACAVGGMTAGLPSQQGFTFIGIAGVDQVFNSNTYFSDDQLTNLRNGGWYVFVQDSETSLPYTIHEVTTDVSSYETGEYMGIKNMDFVATYMKKIVQAFLGRYNITNETLGLIRRSLENGIQNLTAASRPRIGAPLISGTVTLVEQHATERDRVEVYVEGDFPSVLNKVGLHIMG